MIPSCRWDSFCARIWSSEGRKDVVPASVLAIASSLGGRMDNSYGKKRPSIWAVFPIRRDDSGGGGVCGNSPPAFARCKVGGRNYDGHLLLCVGRARS